MMFDFIGAIPIIFCEQKLDFFNKNLRSQRYELMANYQWLIVNAVRHALY